MQRYHSLVQIHEYLMNGQWDLLKERITSIISLQHRRLQMYLPGLEMRLATGYDGLPRISSDDV